jgi:DNA polymerase-4
VSASTSTADTLCRDCLRLSKNAMATDATTTCPVCGSDRRVSHAELTALTIAHVDCDAFYAAVEKRDNPALADMPVIVGHPGGRGVVTTACYVARKFGPRSAMPMFRALELCPDAVVIPPDMAKYKRVSNRIREIFLAATPTIEPVSLDEAYLDLSADVRLHDRPAAVSLAEIALAIERDVGITVSVGLSHNKFLAKLASDLDKPRGFSVIGRAEASDFLKPLSVRKIMGVGEATARRMTDLGIATIGELQGVPESRLIARFGKFGRRLARFAHGEDERVVTPDRPTKSISAETTFATDIHDADRLREALRPLAERVAVRLGRADLAGWTVVLKLKTADFRTLTRNHRLADPTRRADVIHRCAAALIAREADGRAFRLIGVGVSDLCPPDNADPPDLFDAPR